MIFDPEKAGVSFVKIFVIQFVALGIIVGLLILI